eukprot:TRINITY_DN3383_c0_g2_i3.p1 TRINITY_DN3383_c0_g2~~TRINITY_DN3383_c0_g2_i3.p1  ORF type:complete len:348 (+),score=85.76 TRINITY_DN3383_c0_g2_i3:45-1088(+)
MDDNAITQLANHLAESAEHTKQKSTELLQAINARIALLQKEQESWKQMNDKIQENVEKAGTKIKLDVCGKIFTVSKQTLLKHPNTFFTAMLGSGQWQPGEDGTYFIEKDPKIFAVILKYLVSGRLNLSKLDEHRMEELKADLDYFQIHNDELQRLILPNYNSKIVTKQEHWKILQDWLPPSMKIGEKIYSGQEHGFLGTDFHRRCDNKGQTIVLILSTTNHIFGGYVSSSWDSSGTYKNANDTYIYTITNPNNIPPTKYPIVQPGTSIICNPSYGPAFGQDIHVSFQANHNYNGSGVFAAMGAVGYPYNNIIYFPSAYNDTTGHGYRTFTGAQYFAIKEIEVYQVIQ